MTKDEANAAWVALLQAAAADVWDCAVTKRWFARHRGRVDRRLEKIAVNATVEAGAA